MLGVILGAFGGIHFIKGHADVYPWFLAVAAAALLLSVFVPRALKPVFFVFTKVAHGIGWFNTRAILILIYYLLLTPIGLVMKVFRKDSLNRRIDRSEGTYWIRRSDTAATKESLARQF